jgi:hypothetical protein
MPGVLPFNMLARYVNPKVKVEASAKGTDEPASCLLSTQKAGSKWCLNFTANNTWVKFIFAQPIELHAFHLTFADDLSARDPVSWNL